MCTNIFPWKLILSEARSAPIQTYGRISFDFRGSKNRNPTPTKTFSRLFGVCVWVCFGFAVFFQTDLHKDLHKEWSINSKIIQRLEQIYGNLFLQTSLNTESAQLSRVLISCSLCSHLHCWCTQKPQKVCLQIQKTESSLHLGFVHVFIPENTLLYFYHKNHQVFYFSKEFDRILVCQTHQSPRRWNLSINHSYFCLSSACQYQFVYPFFFSHNPSLLLQSTNTVLSVPKKHPGKVIHKTQQCSRLPMATQAIKC